MRTYNDETWEWIEKKGSQKILLMENICSFYPTAACLKQ